MSYADELILKDGKIVEILVNGKPVKRGFMRGMRKAQETSYFKLLDGSEYIARNPFSGTEVILNALEMTIYNFCLVWYFFYERGLPTQAPVQTYDDMKYFLLELNSDAYYDLLD
jgi:hypothetical protein